MAIDVVMCCDCDEFKRIEETRKLKIEGLKQDYYVCLDCLEGLPLLGDQLVEPVHVLQVK